MEKRNYNIDLFRIIAAKMNSFYLRVFETKVK